jgi:ABC-type transporter Mla MlaB component
MDVLVLEFAGSIARAGIPGLCERVREMLEESDAVLIVCDVGALKDPDAVAVDALARLQLGARRHGRRMELTNARGDLRNLLELMGLDGVMPSDEKLRFEPERQAEHREQARRIEEEADPTDPIA